MLDVGSSDRRADLARLRTAVDWPAGVRAFHVGHDRVNPDSSESGTWHVLVVGNGSDAAEHLGLSDDDLRIWGAAGSVALIASAKSGLDVRVRIADTHRWRSMRRVEGTAEYEFRRHGRWITRPDRDYHWRGANGKAEATCRYCVDYGLEQWPSGVERSRDFAAVRAIEPGTDEIELALQGHLGARGYLSGGFRQAALDEIYDGLSRSVRRFLEGILILRALPYRPATEPALVQMFDLLPGQARSTIAREEIEQLHFWGRIQSRPTIATVRWLGDFAARMMGQVAQEIRRRGRRGHRPLSWTLGHLVDTRGQLERVLALPRWRDPPMVRPPRRSRQRRPKSCGDAPAGRGSRVLVVIRRTHNSGGYE